MTLLILFLLFIQGLFAEHPEEEFTEIYGPTQLWRAEDVTSEEVLELFDIRAHETEEIWKNNNTIDFVLNKNDTETWRDVFNAFNISYTVLDKNVTGPVNSEYVQKYERATNIIPKQHKDKYGATQLWRVIDPIPELQAVLNVRARKTDEVWQRNETIDFTLNKNETQRWRETLERYNVPYTILEKDVTDIIDDEYLNKYFKARRAGEPWVNLKQYTSPMKNITKNIDGGISNAFGSVSRGGTKTPKNVKNITLSKSNATENPGDKVTKPLKSTSQGSSKPIFNLFTTLLDNATEKVDTEFTRTFGNASQGSTIRMQKLKEPPLKNTSEDTIDGFTKRFQNSRRADVPPLNIYKYPTLSEISVYLHQLAAAYPQYLTLRSIGRTVHRHDINILKIAGGPLRPAVLLDAGIHGREWAGILSLLYFIESIARNFTKQPEFIQGKDWYIIPVLNPDGYDYSMTTDRAWRKNRRRFSGECYGVDLNRNFDHNWSTKDELQDICSRFYCGPVPFSEEETKAFKKLIEGQHFYAYISIHSAGSKVLYPWRPRGSIRNEDVDTHVRFTREMCIAMRKVAGTYYNNGNVQTLGLPDGSGMAMDWMHFVVGITHTYIIETRGHPGLDPLGKNEIERAVKEVRAGLRRFAEIFK